MNKRYKFDPNNPTATYESRNSEQMDALTDQYLNGSYDPNTDKAFQDYANLMMKQGNQAMRDTVARASSMTGGYGNSYAQSAGQQAYNGYLDQIGAAEQSFRSQYNNDLLSKLGLLEQQEARDKATWENDYAAAYARAQNAATYGGDYTNLAKFMGTDAETLKNSTEEAAKSANLKPMTTELEQQYIEAIKTNGGEEFYAMLNDAGYDTSGLYGVRDVAETHGTIANIIPYQDKPGNRTWGQYSDSVNANIGGVKNTDEGQRFHVKGGKGEKDYNVRIGKAATDQNILDYVAKTVNSGAAANGLIVFDGKLYYADGAGGIFTVEEGQSGDLKRLIERIQGG
jgi:hypothetical protein